MFIIAGISPKTKVLDNNPRRCPVCGMSQAYLKRVDHYFSLFFIPLARVKKGNPTLICDNCAGSTFQMRDDNGPGRTWRGRQCRHCGKILKSDFEYCPYCGKHV